MWWRATVFAVLAMLLLAACGGDGDDSESGDGGASSDPTEMASDNGSDGGSDGGGDDAGSDDSGGDDDSGGPLSGLDFGDGTAQITIGDMDFEFALGGTSSVDGTTYLGTCRSLFGLLAASGYDADGQAITVEIELPPPDWESYEDGRFDSSTPRIEIEDDTSGGGGWVADMTIGQSNPALEGSSQIDEWTIDGEKASGTATFIAVEPFGSPVEGAEPIAGTFEFGCAEE